jgi:small conductance mechanosensitive channel
VSRLSALVARRGLTWYDQRHRAPTGDLRAKIIELKRRETTVGVIRTGIAYIAFALAVVFAAAQLTGGLDRLSTIAGASFVLILVAFSAQRVLVDIIAGFSMFTEKWYSVGDTIAIPTMELQGIVEEVSLRRTKLRSLDGEVINIHNSQIPAVRVLPGGLKEFDVELVASNHEAAEVLIEHVSSILPVGPTTFVQRPVIHEVDELAPGLVRLRMRAAVAPGREWLVHGFYTDLLKERADKHLIVHGPIVLTVDERAARSFARASAESRWAGAR